MKESWDRFDICKKCGHGARLYHNPGGGCIKANKDAPAIPFIGSPNSTEFLGWVVVVCEQPNCKNFNKPVPLAEDSFCSLNPLPDCPKCGKKMKPEREQQRTGNYGYRCEDKDCQSYFRLADKLPLWRE